MSNPPEGKLRYRLLTGPDDDKFCKRVSDALDMGYVLYGSPGITWNGERGYCAQAVIWPGADQED